MLEFDDTANTTNTQVEEIGAIGEFTPLRLSAIILCCLERPAIMVAVSVNPGCYYTRPYPGPHRTIGFPHLQARLFVVMDHTGDGITRLGPAYPAAQIFTEVGEN